MSLRKQGKDGLRIKGMNAVGEIIIGETFSKWLDANLKFISCGISLANFSHAFRVFSYSKDFLRLSWITESVPQLAQQRENGPASWWPRYSSASLREFEDSVGIAQDDPVSTG